MGDPLLYNTHIFKTNKFTAYDCTFEPNCRCSVTYTNDEHGFHKKGQEVANTSNDLLIGIWGILKAQAKWLTGKVGHLVSETLAHEVSESLKGIEDIKVELKKQKQDIIDAIKVEISGSLKGGISQPQEGLDKQTQEYVKDVVNKASQRIGDQNTEILEKLGGFKEEIEKAINDQDLDERFRFAEKVIRDCIADVENKIAKLQRLGRDILEEVSDVGGKTDVEKLVLENNRILKSFQEENLGYQQSDVANLIKDIKVAGLEQLVRREDLNDLEKRIEPNTLVRRMDLKQEIILGKLEEQQKMLKDFDMEKMEILLKNANGEIEEVLKVVSKKVDMLSMDATIAEELAKAKEHLNKAAQYMPFA